MVRIAKYWTAKATDRNALCLSIQAAITRLILGRGHLYKAINLKVFPTDFKFLVLNLMFPVVAVLFHFCVVHFLLCFNK